jgi:hypothetical protein
LKLANANSADIEMTLEEQRLELDRLRFSHEQHIDDLKLELERLRAQSEVRFASRHLASIITGVVSFAAVIVSLSQIVVAYTSKQKELEVAQIQKKAELDVNSAQQVRDWNLKAAAFIVEHQDLIFGTDAEKQSRIAKVMLVTFPAQITGPLFEKLADTAKDSAAKSQWTSIRSEATELLEKLALPTGYFRLQSRATDLYLSLDREGNLIQSKLIETETPIWTTIPTGDKGYCYLTTKYATPSSQDQCLEIKPGKPDDHIGLGKRKTENADDQQWAFEEVQPGYYVITSKLTRQAIDVPWGDPNKRFLGFFFAHKNNNQQWKLMPVLEPNQ